MSQKNKNIVDNSKIVRQDNTSAGRAPFNPQLLANNPLVHVALLIFLILIVYSNSLNVPFGWDESMHIVKEPIIKDLHYFIHPSEAQGFDHYKFFLSRYIPYLTFALNYRIHGLSLPGYHIVNIAIHIANAILLYFLVLLTFRTPLCQIHHYSRTPLLLLYYHQCSLPHTLCYQRL
jgi:hypothetical protein